jgi:sugar phosphate isomerase/epimerase
MHVIGGTKRPMYSEIGLQRVKKIIEVCEELDVNLALENVREIVHINYIFENLKSRKLRMCLDFGHLNCFTKNTFEIDFEKYRDLIICTHIHDNDGSNDQHRLPFYGNVDYQYIAKELKKIGYQGPLTSEARIKEKHMFTEDEFIIKVYEALTKIEKYFGEENE